MLRTIFFLGVAGILAFMLFGLFIGVAGVLIGLMIKVLLFGLLVYFVLRIVSPKTAAKVRDRIEGRTFPPW